MNILIFGRGVVGAQYGWVFEQAGHSVEFYVRPGRAASYGPILPLDIFDSRKSLMGHHIREAWPVRMREDLAPNHEYDLILVSVQHYRFEEAAAFLATRAGRASILLFNNFWTDPPVAASVLPKDQLVWGFPAAGGGYDATGTLRGAFFKQVHFGSFGAALTARELAIRELFSANHFRIVEHKDFRGWLWTHFALNAGLHVQSLQAGSMAKMMSSTSHGKAAILDVREALMVLQRRGVDLKEFTSDLGLFRLPTWMGSLVLKAALRLHRPTRAIVESHANPEELKHFCRDLLSEANRLKVSVPRFQAARPYFSVNHL